MFNSTPQSQDAVSKLNQTRMLLHHGNDAKFDVVQDFRAQTVSKEEQPAVTAHILGPIELPLVIGT